MNFISKAASALKGQIRVASDKSISHRALILGALAEGETQINAFLESEDIRATINVLRNLGVEITEVGDSALKVMGVGLRGLRAPESVLDFGNSGTSVRLFMGLLSAQDFDSELTGDESLMTRPMRRIVDPLVEMGADISCTEKGTLPVQIRHSGKLQGINYEMPVASAQLKSAVLLAGLYTNDKTCVHEPALTRDHSERMLTYFGCDIIKNEAHICIVPRTLKGRDITVPADISSAAFFMVAASIVKDSDVLLEEVGVNPTRHAVIEILKSMGADIELQNEKFLGEEPVADIRIRSAQLKGIVIADHLVPIAIDEFPIIMIAAALAEGETLLRNAAELRVKESDRITAMCTGLRELGIEVDELEDGMRVYGGRLNGGTVDSFDDHRIAMSFAIAGLQASAPVTIQRCDNVNTSFPGFRDCINALGGQIEAGDGQLNV